MKIIDGYKEMNMEHRSSCANFPGGQVTPLYILEEMDVLREVYFGESERVYEKQ